MVDISNSKKISLIIEDIEGDSFDSRDYVRFDLDKSVYNNNNYPALTIRPNVYPKLKNLTL